jgi:predicted anti-sigma-YlaC factor YlaD
MTCDEARETLLTPDLFTNEQLLMALEHLRECVACRGAMTDFEDIARRLSENAAGPEHRNRNGSVDRN